MSKHNNITTDHFKVGGDGHGGENILHDINKQQYTQAQKAKEENASLIPNQHEHNETPAPGGDKHDGGTAVNSSNSSSSDY